MMRACNTQYSRILTGQQVVVETNIILGIILYFRIFCTSVARRIVKNPPRGGRTDLFVYSRTILEKKKIFF